MRNLLVAFCLFLVTSAFAQKFEGLVKTPPMGFNTWNTFASNIDEFMIKETAEAMIKNGMRDAGYNYIVLDDTWSAMERDKLSWEQWAERLQRYYSHVEFLFSPDLFIVGGGVSKHHQHFLPKLSLTTRIVPAAFRNNAGILGAAALAAEFD